MFRKVNIIIMMVLLMPVISLAKQAIFYNDNGSETLKDSYVLVEPSVKSSTSFAIVTDRATFDAIRPSLEAYKTAVESDGLATYIMAADWSMPDEVKRAIIELSKKDIPLEGVALVGDIPVVLSRDAQHMASAFTARQSDNVLESTIATDRFYDDFDLKWNFLCRDTNNRSLFYYSLSFDSPQAVETDIYSARIRAVGKDKYSKLEKYFAKVVAAHKQENVLDDLFMFRGTSYNSETLDGWAGEQIVLREQLPHLFTYGGTVRFVDFDTYYPVKPFVVEYLRRPTLDVVLGHHHGSYNCQYLNDDMKATRVSEAIELVARQVRAKVWRSKNKAQAVAKYAAEYGIPESWVDTTAAQRAKDKAYAYQKDIHIEEIYEIKPQAKFVMFDACDNGSFHLDDCMASAYIFSDGATIATQGNSIGSIQDKHPNAYFGLMASGLRVGQWSRHAQNFLGSHIIGDPTFHFANSAGDAFSLKYDINLLIVLQGKNNQFWLDVVNNAQSSDWQAIAVRKLSDNNYEGIEDLAYNLYKKSVYGSVRMECLKALYNLRPQAVASPKIIEVLTLAMNDAYELVRRFATEYIGNCGDMQLLPALVNAAINDQNSARIDFVSKNSLKNYPLDEVLAEFDRQFAEQKHILYPDRIKSSVIKSREWTESSFVKMLDVLDRLTAQDSTTANETVDAANGVNLATMVTAEEREECLRVLTQLRNYNGHHLVPQVILFAENPAKPLDMRIAAVEVLGWFTNSYRNPEIVAMCNRLMSANNEVAPEALKQEVIKTLTRMK